MELNIKKNHRNLLKNTVLKRNNKLHMVPHGKTHGRKIRIDRCDQTIVTTLIINKISLQIKVYYLSHDHVIYLMPYLVIINTKASHYRGKKKQENMDM